MSRGGDNPFDKFIQPGMQQKGNSMVNLFANQPVTTNVAGNNPPSQSSLHNFFASSSTTQQGNQVQISQQIEPYDDEKFKVHADKFLKQIMEKKTQREDASSEKTVAKQELTEKSVPEQVVEGRMAKKGGKDVTQEKKITPAPVTTQLPSFGPGMTQFVSTEESRRIANEGIANFVKENQKQKQAVTEEARKQRFNNQPNASSKFAQMVSKATSQQNEGKTMENKEKQPQPPSQNQVLEKKEVKNVETDAAMSGNMFRDIDPTSNKIIVGTINNGQANASSGGQPQGSANKIIAENVSKNSPPTNGIFPPLPPQQVQKKQAESSQPNQATGFQPANQLGQQNQQNKPTAPVNLFNNNKQNQNTASTYQLSNNPFNKNSDKNLLPGVNKISESHVIQPHKNEQNDPKGSANYQNPPQSPSITSLMHQQRENQIPQMSYQDFKEKQQLLNPLPNPREQQNYQKAISSIDTDKMTVENILNQTKNELANVIYRTENLWEKPAILLDRFNENRKISESVSEMVQEIAYHPSDVLKTLNDVEKNQDELEKYLEKMEEKIKVTEQHLLSEEIEEINELEDRVADHKLDYAITGVGQEDLLKTIYTTLMSVNTQLNETSLASEKIIGPSKRRHKK